MITIVLDGDSPRPLYEQLYRHIRAAITTGELQAGEKLPSKRKLAAHLQISQRIVENAYAQLSVEGYIEAREKRGYFVRAVAQAAPPAAPRPPLSPPASAATPMRVRYDLRTNAVDTEAFPFSAWAKLLRESLREEQAALLQPIDPQGDLALREEIARYLREFRSMQVSAAQVLLGAGTEYLLGLVCELLPAAHFALENPNYHKPAQILASRGVPFTAVPLDAEGAQTAALATSAANVLFCTPSHHFPLGTVMSIRRRQELLSWAAQAPERYLIEDDYDSEFRYALKPIPALHSLDTAGKVIYLNTFTRTLAPSLRIAYLVLPPALLAVYEQRLRFYACTVSQFEQSTLRRFLAGGYYERHLNRMRTVYKSRRDALLQGLAPLGATITVQGQEAGLHLLLRHRQLTENELCARAQAQGVRVYALSNYYLPPKPETQTVLLGFAGHGETALREAASALAVAWRTG